MKILSLDVSAAKTGWCVWSKKKGFVCGTIETKPKFNRSERLNQFRLALAKVLKKHKPKHIVIEDGFSGINVKTLKALAEFAGVAKEVCQDTLGIDPYVMSNHTVKSYFKVKKKEELFAFVVHILGRKDLTFKKDNDIIDACAQCMCYYDEVLEHNLFREEKEYGFIYKSEG